MTGLVSDDLSQASFVATDAQKATIVRLWLSIGRPVDPGASWPNPFTRRAAYDRIVELLLVLRVVLRDRAIPPPGDREGA